MSMCVDKAFAQDVVKTAFFKCYFSKLDVVILSWFCVRQIDIQANFPYTVQDIV